MQTEMMEMIPWKGSKLQRTTPSYALQIITEFPDSDTGPRPITFDIPYPMEKDVIAETYDLMAGHKVEPTL